MEKMRLKARIGNYFDSITSGEIVLQTRNNKQVGWMSIANGKKHAPDLTKKLLAADGKCISIEITIKEVKKYWYQTIRYRCPVCGGVYTTRLRVHAKPNAILEESEYCGCEGY